MWLLLIRRNKNLFPNQKSSGLYRAISHSSCKLLRTSFFFFLGKFLDSSHRLIMRSFHSSESTWNIELYIKAVPISRFIMLIRFPHLMVHHSVSTPRSRRRLFCQVSDGQVLASKYPRLDDPAIFPRTL